MKIKILILSLILFAFKMQNIKINNDELYLNIDFQDFFENDKTSFLINNCTIFKNKYLTSDKSVGLTNIFMKLKKENSNLLISLNNEKPIKCKTNNPTLVFTIYVNENENIFTIDAENGKYIGIEKSVGNKLILNQSFTPFEYD